MNTMEIRGVIKGQNRYCGPAAISIIAGIDTTRAARLLRMVSGKKMICGIHNDQLTAALKRLGYELRPRKFHPGITFANWFRGIDRDPSWFYLVCSGHHYSIVQGDKYCCGQTVKVVPVEDAPHRRARMGELWTVHKFAEIDPEIVVPTPPKDTSWLKRITVSRRAKQFGIEIDDQSRQGGSIWVYPPVGLFDEDGDDPRDPFNDEHFHDTWDDAEKAVEKYILLKNSPPQVLPIAACPS
jgi:hypothetical protein